MSNFTDQYAYGYRYLMNVFQGVLQPGPSNGGGSEQTAISYRKVATSKTNVDFAASVGLAAEYQTFELWTITLTAGYVPGVGDAWTDQDGQPWNVIKVDADPLVNSVGTPTRYFLLCLRQK